MTESPATLTPHTTGSEGVTDCPPRVTSHWGMEGIDALEDAWRSLTAADQRFWIRFDFYRELIRHAIGGAHMVECLAIHDSAGSVIAIVPIVQTTELIRRVRFRCAELFGSTNDHIISWTASSSDFPAQSPDAARQALELVTCELRKRRRGPSLLRLSRLTEYGWALPAVRALRGERWPPAKEKGHRWIDVNRSYDDIHSRLTNKFRANLRRTRRNIETLGKVEHTLSMTGEPNFRRDFDEFLDVESSGWKGVAGTGTGLAARSGQREMRFFESLGNSGAAHEMEVHGLRLNGRMIAGALHLRLAGTIAAFKMGYTEEFARYGPGHLMIESMLQAYCADPEILYVDFISDADWMEPWSTSFEQHHAFYLPIRGLYGTMAKRLLSLPTLADLKTTLNRTVNGTQETRGTPEQAG